MLGPSSRRLLHTGACLSILTLAATVLGAAPARARTRPAAHYVALGDSFTAGPLIPHHTGHPALCLRSDHNYPSLVAERLDTAEFTDASCSGATTRDITHEQDVGIGANDPQLDSVKSDTTLVTLGIGGNDIHFTQIAVKCVTLGLVHPDGAPCKASFTGANGDNEIAARIKRTGPKVSRVLHRIHARAPHADVYVVGYLRILPATGPGCWPVVPLAGQDLRYLAGAEKKLNAMLERRAEQAGATYVTQYSPGHDICEPADDKWVEGIIPTDPAAPIHPNADGMRATARAVLHAVHQHAARTS